MAYLRRRAWTARGPAHPHEPQTGPQGRKYPHSARNCPHTATASWLRPPTRPPSFRQRHRTSMAATCGDGYHGPAALGGSSARHQAAAARGSYGGRGSLRTCPHIASLPHSPHAPLPAIIERLASPSHSPNPFVPRLHQFLFSIIQTVREVGSWAWTHLVLAV